MEANLHTPQNQAPPLMSDVDIVRAWKDPRYRRSLSAQQLEWLPGNPAGPADLTAEELKAAAGLALGDEVIETTAPECTLCTFNHWKACGCLPETTAINCTMNTATCGCS